jgi:type IV secretory pathway VirB10-like protein
MTALGPDHPVDKEQPLSPSAPIKDQRPRPRGALPRGAQIWFMLGLAAVLLAIMTVTGSPTPKDRRRVDAPVTVASAMEPERIAAYQAQLRERQQELARAAEPSASATRSEAVGHRESPDTSASRDPLDDARKRKEYESLFSSSVAFARGTSGGRATTSPSPQSAANRPDDTLAVLDAQARESLRQLNDSVARLNANPPHEAATTSESRDRQQNAAEEQPKSAPISTDAIAAGTPAHRLLEGTIIDAELRTPLDGEMAGRVVCQITEDVWSFNRDAVVIPKGSKVLGDSKPVAAMGQHRLGISFHRIIFPDGSTRALEQGSGLDQSGATGVRANANSHVWSMFGAAAAVGLITGATQAVGIGAASGGSNRTVVIAGGAAEASGQTASQMMGRFTNQLPTLAVPAGRRLKIYLTRDLELPAYHDGRPTWSDGR